MSEIPPPNARQIPETLGRFAIIEELGVGSMGVVYKAKDPAIGRHLALKTINLTLPLSDKERHEFMARFMREAQAAGKLSHPNIIHIYDVGRDEASGTSYIAMELAPGANLRDFIVTEHLLPLDKIFDIIKQLCGALDYAHVHQVIHRDIKPANLILTPAGDLKITDFGIAKIPQSQLTQTGKFLGTPYYMAPEQILGDEVDGRIDIFSAGVIFYQMLTGKLPFAGNSMAAVAYQIANEKAKPPSSLNKVVPKGVDRIVLKMLEKKPDRRYARGRAVVEAIKEFETREQARAAAASTSSWIHIAKIKVSLPLAITILAAAGFTVAMLLWWISRDPTPASMPDIHYETAVMEEPGRPELEMPDFLFEYEEEDAPPSEDPDAPETSGTGDEPAPTAPKSEKPIYKPRSTPPPKKPAPKPIASTSPPEEPSPRKPSQVTAPATLTFKHRFSEGSFSVYFGQDLLVKKSFQADTPSEGEDKSRLKKMFTRKSTGEVTEVFQVPVKATTLVVTIKGLFEDKPYLATGRAVVSLTENSPVTLAANLKPNFKDWHNGKNNSTLALKVKTP